MYVEIYAAFTTESQEIPRGGGGRELDANPPTPAAPAAPGIYTLLGKAAARAAGGAAADIIVACAVCLVMKCIYNKWI